MSFGFSVGDFLTVAKLISDISASIRGGSSESYQALDVELHSLKRALDEIEHLQSPPGQEINVGQVKVAALNCRQPLDVFSSKLKEYSILGPQLGSNKLEKLRKKVQWRWDMEKDAARLRTTIVAHVAFLNLRLASLGLTSGFVASQKMEDMHSSTQSGLEKIRSDVAESRREQAGLGDLIYEKISEIASTFVMCIGLHLVSLMELAQKIWSSNMQIVALVSEMHTRPTRLETTYTWFQEPVRFEDAFGHIIPIPSEYNWSTVHAIILDRFVSGLGRDKVKAGEYLLYNSLDPRYPLKQSEGSLMPGMSITMTLIMGRYGPPVLNLCPRVGCMSLQVVSGEFGSKLCTVCRCWFNMTDTSIACPLRYESSMHTLVRGQRHGSYRGGRRWDQTPARGNDSNFVDTRSERRLCKNLSIYAMDLPATPKVVNIRRAGLRQRGIVGVGDSSRQRFKDRNVSPSAMQEPESPRCAINSVNPVISNSKNSLLRRSDRDDPGRMRSTIESPNSWASYSPYAIESAEQGRSQLYPIKLPTWSGI